MTTATPRHIRYIFPSVNGCPNCGAQLRKQGSPSSGSHLRYCQCPVCATRVTLAAIGREVHDGQRSTILPA